MTRSLQQNSSHTESASGELRDIIAAAIREHHKSEPCCVWCDLPKNEWSGVPCSAPDGDGHLVNIHRTDEEQGK